MRRLVSSAVATMRAREADSSALLRSSEPAMTLNARSSEPISPAPVSGMRAERSPPASRPHGRLGGDEVEQRGRPVRELLSRSLPRLQEALLPRQDEAALAGLEVEQQPLELVGCDEHVLRVAGAALGAAQVADREQQD